MVPSPRKTLLAAVVTALLVTGFTGPVSADDKDDLERKRKGVSGQISEAEKSFDESSRAYTRAAGALKTAQGKLDAAQATLSTTRGQLAVAQAEDARMQAKLEKSEAALAAAVAKLEKNEATLRASEVEVEQFTVESLQQGDSGLQAFGDLLRGESPSQFSERMTLSDSVGDAQLATMQRLEASRVMLRLNRDEVEALRDEVKADREAAAANLQVKAELEAAAQEQAAAVGELVTARKAASSKAASIKAEDEATLREYEAERNRLNAQLAALAAKELEEARKKGGGGGSTSGGSSGGDSGGTLSYPVNGRVTSQYGMRRHPITGVYKLHDGTDFGAGCGTPIRAPASGTIIQQYFNAGYGNRVILANGVKRGKSIVTTFNHLSRFARGPGAKVSRGEVIGYVGTTGMSTGCHLHFMVIANGATTNPMSWL